MAPRKLFLLFFLGPAHGKKKHQLAIKRQNARGRGCQEHLLKNYKKKEYLEISRQALQQTCAAASS
jgi:hypothetical protein